MALGERTGRPRSTLFETLLDPAATRDFADRIARDRPEAAERSDLANIVWHGGFPALLDGNENFVREWFEGYERTYLERDIMGLGVSDVIPFRRTIRLAAHQAGGLLNQSDLARGLALSSPTIARYLDHLEVAMLGRRLPALAASQRKRIVRSPKFYLADSGLHCHVCGLRDPAGLPTAPGYGAALETWVLQQLEAVACRLSPAGQVSYWRTTDGYEVDFVLEQGDRLVGIEVKTQADPAGGILRGLSALRDEAGERFASGIVVHGGTTARVLGERMFAVPAAWVGR